MATSSENYNFFKLVILNNWQCCLFKPEICVLWLNLFSLLYDLEVLMLGWSTSSSEFIMHLNVIGGLKTFKVIHNPLLHIILEEDLFG